MISYQKDLVWTPGTGTMETMSGKLNWSIKFFKIEKEYTGEEVEAYCPHFSPYDCDCAPGDTIPKTRVVAKKEISKEEYEENK